MMTARRWLSVREATEQLEDKRPGEPGYFGAYRRTLGLVQDGKLTYRLKNPDAARRIYLVSAESVEKYITNTTHHALAGRRRRKG